MTFSIAPMMKCTDQHCRYFHRILTKRAILFTEMISVDAIIFGPTYQLLSSNCFDDRTVLQVGGNDPKKMGRVAKIVEKYGYTEINLNIGCPSNRVKSGNFGACLMASPQTVSDCVKSIKDHSNLNVSIKCRIGIDDMSSEGLDKFVSATSNAGVTKFIIHARKAILRGLSPKQNRNIPPLDYERVKRLKTDNKDLIIILNGGVLSLENGIQYIRDLNLDGFMIGREAYKNPYILSCVDKVVYGSSEKENVTRRMVAFKVADYIDKYLINNNDHLIIRHILGLYNNMHSSREWRKNILDKSFYKLKGDKIRFATDKIEKIISHRKAA